MGLDIGPATCGQFAAVLSECRTIVWNGPMGVFEVPGFDAGTRAVAQALVDNDGMTVIGGGDSAAAFRVFGFDEGDVTHISTGGVPAWSSWRARPCPGSPFSGRTDPWPSHANR